jgi:hypothetical protein
MVLVVPSARVASQSIIYFSSRTQYMDAKYNKTSAVCNTVACVVVEQSTIMMDMENVAVPRY